MPGSGLGPEGAINIYRSTTSAEAWYELDVSSVLARMIDATMGVVGDKPGSRVYLIDNPQIGATCRRVGRIFVESIDDDEEYIIDPPAEREQLPNALDIAIGKPDIHRQPKGKPGEWTVQSLLFDKEFFTLATAKQWLIEHPEFGDYGSDETGHAYHFRQYDTKWFDTYRVITVAPGVSATYAQIATENAQGSAAFEEAVAKFEAMRDVNRMIAKRGMKVLVQERAGIAKADTPAEERYIMGIVLEPTIGDGIETKPDTQDDVYTADTIRKAAHGWMEQYGLIDLQHNWTPLGKENVSILETFLAPADFIYGSGASAYKVLKGTWLLALRVRNDELWQATSNQLGAYSIGGVANRTPVTEEANG